MGKGGKKRDWGYAGVADDGNLIYTSYEKDGSVNRYKDNGDGGHSHEYWEDSNDYNSGEDPDDSRYESNDSPNPDTGEVQDNGGCYLTTACIKHMKSDFNDNCFELTILRWFRDNFVSEEEINHYYMTAPIIVSAINSSNESDLVYSYIYENVIKYCVLAILDKKYDMAYERYKNSILSLEEKYGRNYIGQNLALMLRRIRNTEVLQWKLMTLSFIIRDY